jgi:hypothetical protein
MIPTAADGKIDVTSDWMCLLRRLDDLPPAERQACAIDLAARLVEEAAYYTAEDASLPVVTRLMIWSQDLARLSQQFRNAA